MKNIIEVKHHLIDHSVTVIRRKDTTTEEFRRYSGIVFAELQKRSDTARITL